MKIYSIKKRDGGVMIMRLISEMSSPEAEIERWADEIKSEVADPMVIREISLDDLPEDRDLMDAWQDDGRQITVDVDKAKPLYEARAKAERLRRYRELKEREDLGEDVTDQLAAIKAVSPDFSSATTLDELRALWPEALA